MSLNAPNFLQLEPAAQDDGRRLRIGRRRQRGGDGAPGGADAGGAGLHRVARLLISSCPRLSRVSTSVLRPFGEQNVGSQDKPHHDEK